MEQQQRQECRKELNIVLAVDNGCDSEIAFKQYLSEIHRPGYKLHIVHCCPDWSKITLMEGPSPGHAQELKTKEAQTVKAIKDKYTGLMQEHNVDGHFIAVGGKDVWRTVIEYQELNHADMIVVGCRGLNLVRRTLMGSVSNSIVHHAQCPVLVCRHP